MTEEQRKEEQRREVEYRAESIKLLDWSDPGLQPETQQVVRVSPRGEDGPAW